MIPSSALERMGVIKIKRSDARRYYDSYTHTVQSKYFEVTQKKKYPGLGHNYIWENYLDNIFS